MKAALFLLLLSFAPFAWSHEYFFAFAEADYNAVEKRFEITLEGSAHDVEDVMNETGIPVKELEDHYKDPEMLAKIEAFINKGFQITIQGISPKLHLLGMEVKPNGMVYFYLQSDVTEIADQLTVRFDWLMDVFEKQQNKITLSIAKQKYTAVFFTGKRTELIDLTKKN